MSWPKEDLFAVTADGKVLMNARCLDHIDFAELAKRRSGVFVGIVLQARESRLLSENVYDICSDVAARISGACRKRRTRRHRSR